MTEHRPDVPPWVTADLASHAVDLLGDEPSWGDPLLGVIETRAPWRDWLEAAVLAGYIPHFEGVVLALRGLHAWWLAEIEDSDAQGADGDALGCTQVADANRALIALLEEFVAELERSAAELNRPSAPTAAIEQIWRRDADAAEQRAAHALERKRSAEDDNLSAMRRRQRAEPAGG